MFLSRPCWPVAAAAALLAGTAYPALAQEPAAQPVQEPPELPAGQNPPSGDPAQIPARAVAAQDQATRTGMSESVRRYGRDHRGGRVLGVESIRLNNRNLNRIKTVDDRGRIRVHIDDPQQVPPPAPAPQSPPPLTDTDSQ